MSKGLEEMEVDGEFIPNQLLKHIISHNGKPDLLAVMIYANLAKEHFSELKYNGEMYFLKESNELQDWVMRPYSYFFERYRVSRRQVKMAIDRLVELKLVERRFHIIQSDYRLLSNVMFLRIDKQGFWRVMHTQEAMIVPNKRFGNKDVQDESED